MKLFREFILEEEDTKPVRLRLLPAIKHPSGKIRTGKRGEDHSEIREKHMDEEGPMKGEAGFYDPKERKFLTRKEAAQHAPRQGASGESTEFLTHDEREARTARLRGRVDTTDTMSDIQRMRRYGTFEEEAEDPAISFRKKLDAKRLVPARSGSKGGDAAGDGGGNGGSGGGLEESLNKVRQALERTPGKTNYLGVVSADLDDTTAKQKRANRGKLQQRIRRLIDQKKIKMVGAPKQQGEYRYADSPDAVSREKSFVVAPGDHPKARAEFHGHLRRLGKLTNQESVLKVKKRGKDRPTGTLVFTRKGTEKKAEPVGKMYYNAPMTTGSGRTGMKGKDPSKSAFVITKDTPKGFENEK